MLLLVAVVLLSTGLCLPSTEAARILAFFPFPAKSHHFVFVPILKELANRGHDITYVTPFPLANPPARIKNVEVGDHLAEITGSGFDLVSFGELPVPLISTIMYNMTMALGNHFLRHPSVQALIHSNEKYDVVILESLFVQEFISAFIHKFGAVGVEIMPLGDCSWVNELAGVPDNPAFQVDWKSENTDQMDLWARVYNTYVTTALTLVSYYHLYKMQSFMDEHFNYTGWESRPPIGQLASNKSLILSNADPVLGYPYPMAPHHKQIGGINIVPNKPLPKDLQKYMDGSPHGVIYFSLGSNVRMSDVASKEVWNSFMTVFRTLPQRVLMKLDAEPPTELPSNVKTSTWFPQQDILAHKKCVLFITHGGLLSMFEAVHHGVPLMGIPFFGDQAKNLVHAQTKGYGLRLNYRNISQESVSWALKEVLYNKKYKEEAMRRSRMLRDRRHTSLEEAVYWIEYVIKYPNSLTPASAHMSFIEMHLIDVQLTILAILAAALFILYRMFCGLVGLFRRKPKYEKKQKWKKS